MSSFLAQLALPAPSSPEAVGWVVLTLFGFLGSIASLLGGLVALKKLRGPDTQTIHPQPLVVQACKEWTPMDKHQQLETRVDNIEEQIRVGFERADGRRSESIARIHEKVESALIDVRREIKSDLAGVHQRMTEILAALSKLEGRFDEYTNDGK